VETLLLLLLTRSEGALEAVSHGLQLGSEVLHRVESHVEWIAFFSCSDLGEIKVAVRGARERERARERLSRVALPVGTIAAARQRAETGAQERRANQP
jgi:hypothetical protein